MIITTTARAPKAETAPFKNDSANCHLFCIVADHFRSSLTMVSRKAVISLARSFSGGFFDFIKT
ncbi:hypothetical protein A3A67_03790 [Candidatus Peribacteria bacterium RIFCSPLOWO2_01_FULL_51_18]|nr:MAG: hypothetical protein A3C52_02155 [Candidatus Peribacteria bacterium RIFCSPHIGHO2_02_FULL_51_15]OGJ66946.1 MAG: hypothetical protein A3A67_03790 [Candidatus Peribacteria bacterium RIFCSPLOWO2_01_FULL_51_18]OGJ67369.1 MAG: hypothetical protein A3J34_01140 [Candidatus Peribacteria bacterium RIFCSPLOWO2_02_FULL_51_10]